MNQRNSPNRFPGWLVVLLAILIPGLGHVSLGKPFRGLLFVFWIFSFGYISFHLTTQEISLVGRWAGGIAVWLLSILEVNRLSRQ